MAQTKAPFTEEQVQRLEQWQVGAVHPFTCDGGPECGEGGFYGANELKPTTAGWVCPCGKYTQDWCHDYMVLPEPEFVCTECGIGEMKQKGFTQPNGQVNYECTNCGHTVSFP